ncbi:MAG: LysR family transcriptional regulator [Myxococcales bacterium]|nr:MAG: LysR family transcriptional regulator [Myxococcales bacterium]
MHKQKRTIETLPSLLNYQHLYYFWAVATEGNLTRAAEKLRVTQSAVSVQLRKLEDSIGHALFWRQGRGLELTSHGRLALDYAHRIFSTGDELLEALHQESEVQRKTLRVGALATLSRNFQIALLRPLMQKHKIRLLLRSGSLNELVERLERHDLDLVLTNFLPRRNEDSVWVAHTLDTQPVSLVATQPRASRKLRCLLSEERLVLPSKESGVRIGFDALVQRMGIQPRIIAEVDDMAMLRLVAREQNGVAVVPPIVVRDELESGALIEITHLPKLEETFLALSADRISPHPLLVELLSRTK